MEAVFGIERMVRAEREAQQRWQRERPAVAAHQEQEAAAWRRFAAWVGEEKAREVRAGQGARV